jgi:hypothetical protein
VERTGESIQSSGVGEVGIRESRSDQVSSVSRSIASLVIGMDAKIQPHQFIKGRVVVSQHATEVARIIKRRVFGNNSIKVNVAVDSGSNLRDDGKDVENILKSILVVFILGNTISIRLGKGRRRLSRIESNGELRHGMHVLGKTVEERNDMIGKF